jgi:hypothetical protein
MQLTLLSRLLLLRLPLLFLRINARIIRPLRPARYKQHNARAANSKRENFHTIS